MVSLLELTPSTLISASAGGQILLWSLDDRTEISRTVAHSNSVVTLRSEGNFIVSGGSDGKVKLWDCKFIWPTEVEGRTVDWMISENRSIAG